MPKPMKIASTSDKKFLQILANFSREAQMSMKDGDGLRAGLYLSRINKIIEMRKIVPIELDDVDLNEGLVYSAAVEKEI